MKYCTALIILVVLAISCSTDNGKVYICTGPYATSYHKTPNCKGLDRCSGEVKEIDAAEAADMGRHKCGFCY